MNQNQTISETIKYLKKGEEELIVQAMEEYVNNLEKDKAIEFNFFLNNNNLKNMIYKHIGILSLLFMYVPYGSEEEIISLIEAIINEEGKFEDLNEEEITNSKKNIIQIVEKWKLHCKLINELKEKEITKEKFKL